MALPPRPIGLAAVLLCTACATQNAHRATRAEPLDAREVLTQRPDGPLTEPDEWSNHFETPRSAEGELPARAPRPGAPRALAHKQPGARDPGRGAASPILDAAAALLGQRSLRGLAGSLPDDCTGYVRWAYLQAKLDLMGRAVHSDEGGVGAIFEVAGNAEALYQGVPAPGDLVFFRETYDRNRDGRLNDGLTHIGIVEGVEPDGTVVFLHRANSGVKRSRMHLGAPAERRSRAGVILNDYLRRGSANAPAALTGELFAGFASAAGLRRYLGGPLETPPGRGRGTPDPRHFTRR